MKAKSAPLVQGNLWWLSRERWKDPIKFFGEVRQQLGDVVRIKTTAEDFILLGHPSAAEHIFRVRAENYPKPKLDRALLGDGLLTSEGALWRAQRKLTAPAFSLSAIESLKPLLQSLIEPMLQSWSDGTVNVTAPLRQLVLDFVVRGFFHFELGERLIAVDQDLQELMALGRMRNHYLFGAYYRRGYQKKIHRLRVRRFRDRIGDMLEHQNDPDSLFGHWRMAGEFSRKQLEDMAATVIIAAYETTGSLLSWAFYLLAQHEDFQSALRSELAKVAPDNSVSLAQFIDETMRLYPPAWLFGREAVETDEIDGYVIPKGTRVTLSAYHIHRDPRFWEKPDEFRPDRFSEINARPKMAFLPFGGGTRHCPGSAMAYWETKLIVAEALKRFHFRPGGEVVPEPLLTLRPKGGVRVRASRIES